MRCVYFPIYCVNILLIHKVILVEIKINIFEIGEAINLKLLYFHWFLQLSSGLETFSVQILGDYCPRKLKRKMRVEKLIAMRLLLILFFPEQWMSCLRHDKAVLVCWSQFPLHLFTMPSTQHAFSKQNFLQAIFGSKWCLGLHHSNLSLYASLLVR